VHWSALLELQQVLLGPLKETLQENNVAGFSTGQMPFCHLNSIKARKKRNIQCTDKKNNHLNGLFPGLPGEAGIGLRVAVASAGPYANCKHFAPDR